MDYNEAIQLGKSENQKKDGGRPLFYYEAVDVKQPDGQMLSENQVWVKIFNIGDSKNIIVRPKRDVDETRWPEHWKAFQEGTEVPPDGTPIRSFPFLTPADIKNCVRLHIRTVEELAEYPDVQIKSLGGRGYAMKKAAAEFVEYRKTDTSELRARIAELEKRLGNDTEDGAGRVGGNRTAKADNAGRQQQSGRKKRGRPRKSVNKEPAQKEVVDSAEGS